MGVTILKTATKTNWSVTMLCVGWSFCQSILKSITAFCFYFWYFLVQMVVILGEKSCLSTCHKACYLTKLDSVWGSKSLQKQPA